MPGWLYRQYDALITWMLLQEYYAEAISAMKKLMKHVINYYGEESAMTGEIALRMAAAYYNAREYESADLWHEKSYAILREAKDRDLYQTAILARACSKLSRTFRHRSDYLTAMQRIDETLETNTNIREQSRILTVGGKNETHSGMENGYEIAGALVDLYIKTQFDSLLPEDWETEVYSRIRKKE